MTDFDRPFSRRYGDTKPRLRDQFPEDGRTALVHVFASFVLNRYVNGWEAVLREVLRIGRQPLTTQATDNEAMARKVEAVVLDLPWERVFDLCERVCATLAVPTTRWSDNGEYEMPDKNVDDV